MNIDRDIVHAVGTLRVSSTKQGLQGDSHEDQKKQIENRATQMSAVLGKEVLIVKWFKFTESASGDFDKQPLNEAIDYCLSPQNKIKYFLFKSIDRMTRGGSVIYSQLKSKLAKGGVECVDAYGIIGIGKVNTLAYLGVEYPWSTFSPTSANELQVAEDSKNEVRTILTRMIGAEINYVRLGYRVRQAPPGFKNTKVETPHGIRVVLSPHPTEADWFIRMFELREQGYLSDKEIVIIINKLGFKTRRIKKHDPKDKTKIIGYAGELPLDVEKLQKYIKNPIYAGINTEKWTNNEPVKGKFDGLVSIETFNRANRGARVIIEEDGGVKVYKDKLPLWKLRKQKENPLYPYKQQVLCPKCRKPVLGSASRSKSGKYVPRYHCARNHKYWSINSITFNKAIQLFVENVKFSDEYRKRFQEIVLEEWDKRKEHVKDDSIVAEKQVLRLKEEQKLIKEKIKMLNSPATIRAMEEDYDKLDDEISQAMQLRDNHEDKVFEIQTLINYADYFMEHLEDLLLGSANPFQNASLFGLAFDKQPTYDEIINGTPNLAPMFVLNEEYKKSKSLLVTPTGIEPVIFTLKG